MNLKFIVTGGIIKVKQLHFGQMGAYRDSIYDFEIISAKPEDEVEKYCTTEIRKCGIKDQGACFSGNCGFPHDLNSYYKFRKTGENTYRYTVCEPYTG